MLPDISLHADAVEGVLPQKREPHLHRLGMAILYLHQPPARDALKVFLAFLYPFLKKVMTAQFVISYYGETMRLQESRKSV